jgi:hypothetical protein
VLPNHKPQIALGGLLQFLALNGEVRRRRISRFERSAISRAKQKFLPYFTDFDVCGKKSGKQDPKKRGRHFTEDENI